MKAKKLLITSSIMLLVAGALASCDTSVTSSSGNTVSSDTTSVTEIGSEQEDVTDGYTSIDASEYFSNKDYVTDYADEDLKTITLADDASSTSADSEDVTISGNVITISAKGYYVLSGELSEGQIILNNDDDEKFHLILDNVSISNSSAPAILVSNADKVFMTTAEGSVNTISSDVDGEADENAAIYSHDDLTLNGLGTLTVTASSAHGIKSSDELTITSGTYNVTAEKNCLRGKDSVAIADGTFNLNAGTDGIHSENNDNEEKGNVYIIGGDINIAAGDDAIHAEKTLTIYDGDIDISSSYEGIEGQNIYIGGGDISVRATDDGVNCGDGTGGGTGEVVNVDTQSSITFTMAGGSLYVNSDADGIDSNGYIWINGGEIVIDGPTDFRESAIDFDADCYFNVGTVIGIDASENLETFSNYSTQGNIMYCLDNTASANTLVTLKDSSNVELMSYTPSKEFSTISFSSSDVVVGETYTLTVGDDEYTIKMETTAFTNYVESNSGGMPGGDGGPVGGGPRP